MSLKQLIDQQIQSPTEADQYFYEHIKELFHLPLPSWDLLRNKTKSLIREKRVEYENKLFNKYLTQINCKPRDIDSLPKQEHPIFKLLNNNEALKLDCNKR